MAKATETQHTPSPALKLAKSRSENSQARIRDLENQTYERKPQSNKASRTEGGTGTPKGELRGSARDFELVEGRVDDIMGVLTGRVHKHRKARQNIEEKKPGRSDSRTPDLTIPLAREKRLATHDGRTSFHFSHDAVSKVNKRTVGEDEKVNRPFAAKAHNQYIERDDAVAIDDTRDLGGLRPSAEAADVMNHPIGSNGAAALQGAYIERQEALATQPDGQRVLFTNIDDDPEKRAEYWQLVENRERDAERDKMTFTISNHPGFWKSVSEQLDCPDALKRALETAHPEKPVTIETESNIDIRAFLGRQEGFIPVPKIITGEDQRAYRKRCNPAHEMMKFHDGRGGRIQYRVIGELPHELSIGQRAAILHDFVQEFAKRKLPFVAVMHAPDHTNNDKNWHFHLVYHDRPARRVTRADVDAYENGGETDTKSIKPFVLSPVGRWDFDVEHDYVRKGKYETRTNFPFRQDKVHEVTRAITETIINKNGTKQIVIIEPHNWLSKLRVKLADITNDHLGRGGVQRRIDPRRHEQMGIHSDPQQHLGTKLSNLEAMGVATPLGVTNEERQWKAVVEKIEGDIERRKRGADKEVDRYLAKIDKSNLPGTDKNEARRDVTRWHHAHSEAREHGAIAERLIEHMDRAKSRARKVADMAVKNLNAIDTNKASRYLVTRQAQLKQKRDEAEEYLSLLHKHLVDERALVVESQRAARDAEDHATEIAKKLTELLYDTILIDSNQTVKLSKEVAARKGLGLPAVNSNVVAEALNKSAMDVWIDSVRRDRRRLATNGRRIIPLVAIDGDEQIINAPNYSAMALRLKGIKDQQDKIINEVVAYIASDPASVRTRMENGALSYFITVARPQWVQAFDDYQHDPALAKARDAAAMQSKNLNANIDGERLSRIVDERTNTAAINAKQNVPGVDIRPKLETTDQAQVSKVPIMPEPTNNRATVDAFIKVVREMHLRVKAEQGIARVVVPSNESAPDAWGIELLAKDVQIRLLGIAALQDLEIKRLLAYVRSNPARMTVRNGDLLLSADAPKELVVFSQRWRNEDEVRALLPPIVSNFVENPEPAFRIDVTEHKTAPVVEVLIMRPDIVDIPVKVDLPHEVVSAKPKPRLVTLPNHDAVGEKTRQNAEAERKRRAEIEHLRSEGHFILDPIAERNSRDKAPEIDIWLDAAKNHINLKARRAAAQKVFATPSAREALQNIDLAVARRIRDDEDQANAIRRVGLDRGVEPQR
jgi:MobA/MobL family